MRDLDVTRYNVPFLLHPFIALYTTRGCPAQCTFCLWPQTLSGHAWRKRSFDDLATELAWAKRLLASPGRAGSSSYIASRLTDISTSLCLQGAAYDFEAKAGSLDPAFVANLHRLAFCF